MPSHNSTHGQTFTVLLSNQFMAYVVLLIIIEGLEEMGRRKQVVTLVAVSLVSAPFFTNK